LGRDFQVQIGDQLVTRIPNNGDRIGRKRTWPNNIRAAPIARPKQEMPFRLAGGEPVRNIVMGERKPPEVSLTSPSKIKRKVKKGGEENRIATRALNIRYSAWFLPPENMTRLRNRRVRDWHNSDESAGSKIQSVSETRILSRSDKSLSEERFVHALKLQPDLLSSEKIWPTRAESERRSPKNCPRRTPQKRDGKSRDGQIRGMSHCMA